MEKFTITKDHLKLVQRLNVHLLNNVPYIDSYRPYGNSDFHRDIIEILSWKINKDKNGDEFISDSLEKKILKIHSEMTYVLQICLQLLQFKTGTFVKNSYGIWKKLK